ncbi:importin subunit alpha-1 [Capsella rubella]|uniref:importin subunit alpha-1 n=1 Tax=Capsella rubella TaxID=81985 RepID=UPI000CD52DF0|nr:importin subunit alpha-1 [Capsella rubella]
MSLNPEAKKEVDKEMIAGVFSDDPSIQFKYASMFNAQKRPVDKIVNSGNVPRYAEFLKMEDSFKLQCVAASILRHVSEKNTKVLIDHGAVQIFVHLLAGATDDYYLHFQVMRALGNVASASIQSRDYVLRCGALTPLLAQFHENNNQIMVGVASWTLSNFCSGMPPPPFRQMKPALSALQQVLHRNDESFLLSACCTLHNLSDGSKETIQSFIDAGLVPRIVQLLGNVSPTVIGLALTTILGLTIGDNQQTQVVIESDVLPLLANLLTRNPVIQWKTCWTISNITAGTQEQIQAVIDANLIPPLVNLAQNAELDIKEKAVLAVSNATSGGSHDQIKYLVEQGCIKPLCDLLVSPDMRIILKCLYGLENILRAGDVEEYSQLIKDAEGLEKIVNLQHHKSKEVSAMALEILETYWKKEDDEQTQQPLK